MTKKEISKGGYNIVLEDGKDLDTNRLFLVNQIEHYANLQNKQLKIVFFNAKNDEETGVSFFFRRTGGNL